MIVKPVPSPFADHDLIRAKALSGQREHVWGDNRASPVIIE